MIVEMPDLPEAYIWSVSYQNGRLASVNVHDVPEGFPLASCMDLFGGAAWEQRVVVTAHDRHVSGRWRGGTLTIWLARPLQHDLPLADLLPPAAPRRAGDE